MDDGDALGASPGVVIRTDRRWLEILRPRAPEGQGVEAPTLTSCPHPISAAREKIQTASARPLC